MRKNIKSQLLNGSGSPLRLRYQSDETREGGTIQTPCQNLYRLTSRLTSRISQSPYEECA